MGQVDQHALLLQAGDYLAAQRGQPALDQTMGRATDLVVEEVSQAGDAKAGVIQAVEVLQLTLDGLQPFGGQHGGQALRVALPVFQVAGQLGAVVDQHQFTVAGGSGLLQLVGLVQGAGQQAAPGFPRPALGHGQQGDVVAVGAVALVVDAARGLGDGGKHLQADAALEQARQVGVAVVVALEQVALPEQGIVVQVGDEQALVQLLGLVAGRVGRRRRHAVHLPVEQVGQREEGARAHGHEDQQGEQQLGHGACPIIVVVRRTLARRVSGWR